VWKDGGTAREDIIKILILLALLKLKSRMRYVDFFRTIMLCLFWSVLPI
jgi:hypothetical protein